MNLPQCFKVCGNSKYSRQTVALMFAAVVLITGNCCRTRRRFAFDGALGYLMAQNVVPVSFSPNERFLLRKTYNEESFTISVLDRRTGELIRNLSSPDSQLSLTWRPDSKGFAYVADHRGDRNYRLYLLSLETGQVQGLEVPIIHTAAPPLRWSPDSRYLAFDVGGEPFCQLTVLDVGTRKPKVQHVAGGVTPKSDFEISPAGESLAFIPADSPGAITICPLAQPDKSSQCLEVCPGGEVRDLAWGSDGSTILYTARGRRDQFFKIGRVNLNSGTANEVFRTRGDIQRPRLVPGSADIVFEANIAGVNLLERLYMSRGRSRQLSPSSCDSQILGFSPDGKFVECMIRPAEAPAYLDRYRVGMTEPGTEQGKQKNTRRPFDVVIDREVGSNKGPVHCSLWIPRLPMNAKFAGAVVYVHGGPDLQERPRWKPLIQLLMDRRILYVNVNYRGSTGFGRRYEEEASDEVEGADVATVVGAMTSTYGVSLQQIVLLGESYGSSVTAKALTILRKRLAGVVLVSPPNTSNDRCPAAFSPGFVQAYQGVNDPLSKQFDLREMLSQTFGEDLLTRCDSLCKVVTGEGHQFRRNATWAEIYDNLIGGLLHN
jgi:dipeptidyl aminopeptidase/acylaminoacyl peptidase